MMTQEKRTIQTLTGEFLEVDPSILHGCIVINCPHKIYRKEVCAKHHKMIYKIKRRDNPRLWCDACDKKNGSTSWLIRLIRVDSKRSKNTKSGFSTVYIRSGVWQCPKCKSVVLESDYPEEYMLQRFEKPLKVGDNEQ